MQRRALLLSLSLPGLARPARAAPATTEPVIGGPCEGCEWVFEGRPATAAWQSRIAPPDEPGEPLVIEGLVRDRAGAAAPGIWVYAYHTDALGLYPAAATRHGRLRGWALSDAQGRYRFDTIRPRAYPSGGVPEHVHFHVIEPGRGTYWLDDLVFTDDPLLRAERRKGPFRGGDGLATPRRDAQGRWWVRRDIQLGLSVSG